MRTCLGCLESVVDGKEGVLTPDCLFASRANLAVHDWGPSDKICCGWVESVLTCRRGSLCRGHVLGVQQQWSYEEINE